MSHASSPDQVLQYLADVDFPADKDTLVAAAERAGAPEGVVRSLRAIPPVEYANRAEVGSSVPTSDAPDPSGGKTPVQSSLHAQPGDAGA